MASHRGPVSLHPSRFRYIEVSFVRPVRRQRSHQAEGCVMVDLEGEVELVVAVPMPV